MQMGDLGPFDESAVKAVDHKSCKSSLFHGHAFVGEDHFNGSSNEIVEMDLLMESLEISDEDDLNDLVLEECEDLHVEKPICSSISNKKLSQCSSPNATKMKDFSKCVTILCSEALQSCPSVLEKAELSIIELGYESSLAVSNSTEDSLVPYHDSSKFLPALKGSRARQGKPLDPNLRVTWAANVYDPPVTSSSHTVVKGHHRHHHRIPKAKMSSDHHKHKHKHMKAKPSNASGGDRKHSHRRSSRSITDPRTARMQTPARRSLQAEALDMAALGGLESSKCRGSFHAESPWPLPRPIAEAS